VTEESGAWGGYPSGSGVPPSPEKLQCTSNTIVLPLIFGIWFGVFPVSTAHRPIQLQSATRRPDCAWTVGIASVGTESVGIVWCTPYNARHYLNITYCHTYYDIRTLSCVLSVTSLYYDVRVCRLYGMNLTSVLLTRRSSSGAPASELASRPTFSTNFKD